MHNYSIQHAVADEPTARSLAPVTTLSGDIAIALWERHGGGPMPYPRPNHHTLSIYVAGGAGVRHRLGRQRLAGGHPGVYCVMPEGEATEWENAGYVSMLHIYFAHADLERLFEQPMQSPAPVTFGENALFAGITRSALLGLDWNQAADRLALDHAVLAMLSRLGQRNDQARTSTLTQRRRGQLAPTALARVKERIEAGLDEPLRIEQLAAEAHLSARHFARLFTASTGETPHQYVLSCRIARAQALLSDGVPLAQVAVQCGFSSQSHFALRFRQAVGVNPGTWAGLRD